MDIGIGFTEILLILLLILVFFGSKELPGFIQKGARLLARIRKYGENVRRELKGKIPLFGFAFDCQIHDGLLPFSKSDMPMDQIITESGFKLPEVLSG